MRNNSLVTVKNNREGRRFIALLRKQLRNTPKGVRLYGHGYRHGNVTYHQNLPHSKSQRFAVYIYDKPKTRMMKVIVPQPDKVEWRQVPTKWATV